MGIDQRHHGIHRPRVRSARAVPGDVPAWSADRAPPTTTVHVHPSTASP
ncbi:hypothetical protein ACH495_27685 [Micromonospora sp. NPDC018662]